MVAPIGDRIDLEALGLAASPAARRPEALGQEEFLSLMLAQLKNQDPFKPLESGEFLGQLAQFGTVTGIAELKTAFEELAGSLVPNQQLAAAQLVGRDVLVTSRDAYLAADGAVRGAIELPAGSPSVQIQIRDAAGQVVRELSLGEREAGLVRFEWDGITDGGERAPAGRYSMSAQFFEDGEMRGATTFVVAAVESVRFGPRGLAVQLTGLGELPFSAVQEIG